ncbi:MAG: hypothetical protein R3B72_15020 [Polyangiaceae bacterium]
MRRWLPGWALLAFVGAGLLANACKNDDAVPEGLCEPGTEIFCRCPGGEDSGTKHCLDSGEDFSACEIAPGTPCGERVLCTEGERIPCLCPNGAPGDKTCLRDESSYSACQIDGDPCPDPEGGTGGGGVGGGGSTGGGGGDSCAHDVCETGDPLTATCSTCADAVCTADPYCCETKWDILCLDIVDQQCDGACTGPTACAHDLCEEGDPLDAMCSTCVAEVCASDGFCCGDNDGFWDVNCIAAVEDDTTNPACAGICGCDHDECATGVALDPMCSPCAQSVCAIDNWCCTNSWDSTCVQRAIDDVNCPGCVAGG